MSFKFKKICYQYKNKNQGFTLMEIMIYLAIVSFFVVAVTTLAWDVVADKTKNDSLAEVNDNSGIIVEYLKKSVKSAKQIVSPAEKGQNQTSLNLLMNDDTTTLINTVNNRLQITEGSNNPVYLSSSRVLITNLNIINLTKENTAGNLRIQFDIALDNPSGRSEYNVSNHIDTSFSLR